MTCINCNKPLNKSERFCSVCGNKNVTKRLTFKNIVTDFSNQFFNWDNKLFVTFWHLIKKPEFVIDVFIAGNRKRYVNVLSYMAIALTLAGFQIFITQNFFPRSLDLFKGLQPEQDIEYKFNLGAENFAEYYGVFVILFIPFAAISTYLLLQKRRHNYAEHIVLNIYIAAQYTIMSFFIIVIGLILQLNSVALLTIASFVSYFYFGYALKRLYGLSLLGALWRTIVSQLIIFLIIITLMILLALVITLLIKIF